MVKLINKDCLKAMEDFINLGYKVNAIITDLPQGLTHNKWDSVIPLEEMWKRINFLKMDSHTPVILFSNQPFTSKLILSNIKQFKVIRYWIKDRPSGFLNANKMPLKNVEEILIFYNKQPVYNPQKKEGKENHSIGKAAFENNCKNNNNYNDFSRVNTKSNLKYPRQTMEYKRPHPPVHPTEKPVDLLKELILTYTNEGDTVLDFTMGSGSTGVACVNTNRNFIGIEKDEKYFKIAKERIEGSGE